MFIIAYSFISWSRIFAHLRMRLSSACDNKYAVIDWEFEIPVSRWINDAALAGHDKDDLVFGGGNVVNGAVHNTVGAGKRERLKCDGHRRNKQFNDVSHGEDAKSPNVSDQATASARRC